MKTLIDFLNNTILELKKVEWLNRKNLIKYTIIVIVILIVGALFVYAGDQLFTLARKQIIFQSI